MCHWTVTPTPTLTLTLTLSLKLTLTLNLVMEIYSTQWGRCTCFKGTLQKLYFQYMDTIKFNMAAVEVYHLTLTMTMTLTLTFTHAYKLTKFVLM